MILTFYLGLFLLVLGVLGVAFPSDKKPLTRLINLEVPAFGLLLVMLAYSETLALLTFIATTTITTFVLVRVIQRRNAV